MSDTINIAIVGGIIVGLYVFRNQISNFFGSIGKSAANAGLGFTTGIASAINPNDPTAMAQNNTIRASFGLNPDKPGALNYPFTNIPIDTTQQTNSIRGFLGLFPENNNVNYFPFTNIPLPRTS